jgi:hypothetical protein
MTAEGPVTETQERVLRALHDRGWEGLTRDEIPQLAWGLGMTEELVADTLGQLAELGCIDTLPYKDLGRPMTDSDLSDELGVAVAAEELRRKGWIVPVYDEHGQRREEDGQIWYTLSPAGLDEVHRQFPEKPFDAERYAKAQEMLDRALRFDPETRARFGDQT